MEIPTAQDVAQEIEEYRRKFDDKNIELICKEISNSKRRMLDYCQFVPLGGRLSYWLVCYLHEQGYTIQHVMDSMQCVLSWPYLLANNE